MVELGDYAFYIIVAYSLSFLILMGVVVHTLHQYFRTKSELSDLTALDDVS